MVAALALFAPVAGAAGGPYFAWGYAHGFSFGDGSNEAFQTTSPKPVNLAPGVSPTAITGGNQNGLAIGSDGNLYAWGSAEFVGDGTIEQEYSPKVISLAPGVQPTAITVGFAHTAAIGSDNQLYSWGIRNSGEAGDGGTVGIVHSPELITLAPGVTPVAISGRAEFTLAIGSDGHVYGWGGDVYGLEDETHGSATYTPQPILQGSVPFSAQAVSAGCGVSLAISGGKLYTWGYGLLGNGAPGDGAGNSNSAEPIPIALPAGVSPTAISSGCEGALVIGSDDKLYSWGKGPVGDGTTETRKSPVPITLEPGVSPVAIVSSRTASLALGSNGTLYSWGAGQALGRTGSGLSPAPVIFPPGVSAGAISADIESSDYVIPSGSVTVGGAVKAKLTKLIGNAVDKVSGTGWTSLGDQSVTLYNCATPYYTDSSCASGNSITATLTKGKFKSQIKLKVGKIGHHENRCGIVGAGGCYIVALGENGDETATPALGFKLPTATVKLGTAVPDGYPEIVKASNFPAGDVISARECDSEANLENATSSAQHCESREIGANATKSGKVKFTSPKTLIIRSGEDFEELGSGTCPKGGTCSIVVRDNNNPAVYVVVPITLAP